MDLATARRLHVAPEKVIAHCGVHLLELNRRGLIESSTDGYYFHRTRFLSRFALSSAGGRKVKPVSCANVEPHATTSYYLLPTPAGRMAAPPGDDDPSGGEIVAKGVEIQINAFVGGGFHQDVLVTNHGLVEANVELHLDLAADFADRQEVGSGGRRQNAPVSRRFLSSTRGQGELTLTYEHPRLRHATRITVAGATGDVADRPNGLSVSLHLEPQRGRALSVDVAPVFLEQPIAPWFTVDGEPTATFPDLPRRRKWLADACAFEASNARVEAAWARAATDLYALQSLQGDRDEIFTPIAGVPKYSGLFGRDSLVTGIQSVMLNRSTLNGALRAVGAWTAKAIDDRYDAEPGKVLHQRQLGPLALLGETPFQHYYGDYSAPAYYLIGAARHFAESGDRRAFEDIRDHVEATLAWMDRYGDIDGDGFYEYRTRAKKGIKNQGWKDSEPGDPLSRWLLRPRPDRGRRGAGPVLRGQASCRLRFRGARRDAGGRRPSSRKRRRSSGGSTRASGCPISGFIALALDPRKEPGQDDRFQRRPLPRVRRRRRRQGAAVVERLMRPDMFSGWGLRTLSSEHPAFNPLSYHLGSVWPVSNAHACVGLKRYGFNGELHRLAKAAFEATALFDFDRLPEVFGGHQRGRRQPHPGLYPDACSPQAWSASAVIQICHMMTGIMTLAPLKTLVIDPALPEWLPEVVLRNLWIGDDRVSIILRRDANGETNHDIIEGAEGWRILRPEPGRPGRDRFALALAQARL